MLSFVDTLLNNRIVAIESHFFSYYEVVKHLFLVYDMDKTLISTYKNQTLLQCQNIRKEAALTPPDKKAVLRMPCAQWIQLAVSVPFSSFLRLVSCLL